MILSTGGPAVPLIDLQAAVADAIAALDRLERAVKVRPGDDPRVVSTTEHPEPHSPSARACAATILDACIV